MKVSDKFKHFFKNPRTKVIGFCCLGVGIVAAAVGFGVSLGFKGQKTSKQAYTPVNNQITLVPKNTHEPSSNVFAIENNKKQLDENNQIQPIKKEVVIVEHHNPTNIFVEQNENKEQATDLHEHANHTTEHTSTTADENDSNKKTETHLNEVEHVELTRFNLKPVVQKMNEFYSLIDFQKYFRKENPQLGFDDSIIQEQLKAIMFKAILSFDQFKRVWNYLEYSVKYKIIDNHLIVLVNWLINTPEPGVKKQFYDQLSISLEQ
ncbi:hypothetical protein OF376_01125 [Ureaplasma miroungigenitalium]|uniref:DUF4476 domain-containing protein n=1 Tax=Ureaplasma miroungigenitalium TaxID=1042321 RepID=A0ABT3BMA6_9BACT|nr:DUF5452 domain-containing protein [Ureaplasma miroungigenitalium]MCV3728375.1 hypothetical protein [Ureaplasma miroungigenitalium]